jgi:hypothetical protein
VVLLGSAYFLQLSHYMCEGLIVSH